MQAQESAFAVFTQKPVEYAGFWLRAVALLIDTIAICGVLFLLELAISLSVNLKQSHGLAQNETAEIIMGALVIFFCFPGLWLYYAIMESSRRQATLGKMALGIKVTDTNGNRISFGRASGRFFAKVLSYLILYIGYFMAGFTKRKQGLHDMMADCLVVRSNSSTTY